MEGLEKTASQPSQRLLVSILHRVPCLFSLLYSEPLTHTAPSAPPTSVSVYALNSTAITVQWGPVDCIHRNGDITGYSVQYGSETVSVSGDSSGGMYVISGLMPSTTYSIQVAAETSNGTGPYSAAIVNETRRSK